MRRLPGRFLCAQQADRIYRIGYLSLGSPGAEATRFDAFRAGLAALGYVEGRNLIIETCWLDGRSYDELAGLATQLSGGYRSRRSLAQLGRASNP